MISDICVKRLRKFEEKKNSIFISWETFLIVHYCDFFNIEKLLHITFIQGYLQD